jgi:putative RecB family exonuclease
MGEGNGMTVYSHTRLGAFESCPRKYWYGYIGKPPIEKAETIEAFLGQRVHEALEALYRRVMKGRVMAEDELLALYERHWKREWSDAVRVVRPDETAADYQAVGRKALSDYHRRFAPFDQARTLKVEARVQFTLDDEGRYVMGGYVDRIARRADGTFEVHDYKTSGRLPTQATLDGDRQLALYHLGVERMWQGIERVELIWHYLRFDMPIVSHRTPEQLAGVKRSCIALIDEIEARGKAEQDFPTKPSRLCDWCDFRSICPATRHAVALETAGPLAAGADEGLRLVDALAEAEAGLKAARQQERELEARREALIERLVAWAREQGFEGVKGTQHRAEIRMKEVVEYPKAGDDLREAFETALREAGVWDGVAALSHARLVAWWVGGPPEAVREALASFIGTREEFEAKLKPLAPSRDEDEE